MKNITIILLFIVNIMCSQNIEVQKKMDYIYQDLFNQNGISIDFEYFFENESHKMNMPILGNITLFSDNRFVLQFKVNESEVRQIYNGIALYTILMEY